MKIKIDEKYLKYSFYSFLTIAASIVFYFALGNAGYFKDSILFQLGIVRKVLSPVIMAIFIAYILNPGVRWFEENIFNKTDKRQKIKKLPRLLSIMTVYIILFGFIALLIVFVAPQIVSNIADIIRRVPEYINLTIDLANEWSDELSAANNIYDVTGHIEKNINEIFTKGSKMLEYILNNTIVGVLSITSGILNFMLGIIISFYLLSDKETFKRGFERMLLAILNKETVEKLKDAGREANMIFGKFIVGKSIDSLIIGIMCFIGLSIMSIKYALLISVIVGITNMIPYFGPFIGAVPAIIITLFDSPIKALWVAIFIILLQQFDGLILGPKILGDSVGVSPFWIIFSIVLGGGLYGVIGMFLGVPVVAIARVFINRLIDWQLERKNIGIEDKEQS